MLWEKGLSFDLRKSSIFREKQSKRSKNQKVMVGGGCLVQEKKHASKKKKTQCYTKYFGKCWGEKNDISSKKHPWKKFVYFQKKKQQVFKKKKTSIHDHFVQMSPSDNTITKKKKRVCDHEGWLAFFSKRNDPHTMAEWFKRKEIKNVIMKGKCYNNPQRVRGHLRGLRERFLEPSSFLDRVTTEWLLNMSIIIIKVDCDSNPKKTKKMTRQWSKNNI